MFARDFAVGGHDEQADREYRIVEVLNIPSFYGKCAWENRFRAASGIERIRFYWPEIAGVPKAHKWHHGRALLELATEADVQKTIASLDKMGLSDNPPLEAKVFSPRPFRHAPFVSHANRRSPATTESPGIGKGKGKEVMPGPRDKPQASPAAVPKPQAPAESSKVQRPKKQTEVHWEKELFSNDLADYYAEVGKGTSAHLTGKPDGGFVDMPPLFRDLLDDRASVCTRKLGDGEETLERKRVLVGSSYPRMDVWRRMRREAMVRQSAPWLVDEIDNDDHEVTTSKEGSNICFSSLQKGISELSFECCDPDLDIPLTYEKGLEIVEKRDRSMPPGLDQSLSKVEITPPTADKIPDPPVSTRLGDRIKRSSRLDRVMTEPLDCHGYPAPLQDDVGRQVTEAGLPDDKKKKNVSFEVDHNQPVVSETAGGSGERLKIPRNDSNESHTDRLLELLRNWQKEVKKRRDEHEKDAESKIKDSSFGYYSD